MKILLNRMDLFEWINILGFVFTAMICAIELASSTRISSKASWANSSSQDLLNSTSSNASRQLSKGDENRLEFYRLLFIAVCSRLILLLFEGYLVVVDDSRGCSSIECTIVRTVPDLLFSLAFLHMVLFFANLLVTTGRGPQAESWWMEMISGPTFFKNATLLICFSYLIILAIGGFDFLTYKDVVSGIFFFLAGIYSTLFVGILFFGRSLLRVLKPSLEQRSVLAFRLACLCGVCFTVLPCRAVVFAFRATTGSVPFVSRDTLFTDNLTFCLFELIPSIIILFLMRQAKPPVVKNSDNASSRSSSANTLKKNPSGGAPNNLKSNLLMKPHSGMPPVTGTYGSIGVV
mmetsp:Transcript_10109/g.13153  ORF Transcript_10109/g.13153 Transcript_10109/m.13153 type:complete len:347 (-) Transcript_10109:135-1175(-)